MGDSHFDLIMDEVLKQKQLMDEMIAENHKLRRQLADLRAGRGITLTIEGVQFALDTEEMTNLSLQALLAPNITPMGQDAFTPAEAAPVASLPTITMGTIPETPYPSTDEFDLLPEFSAESENDDEAIAVPTAQSSTFLEDMLFDEFAAAATSPMAVWKSPVSVTKKLTAIDLDDEDQKAMLRKELIGSFLLE